MKRALGVILLFLVFFTVTRVVFSVEEYATNAAEAEAYNVTRVQKIVDGHVFTVEADRPIEKVAGLYRPMDMDAYIQLKFNKLQVQINDLANRTKSRMDVLEGRIHNLSKRIDQLNNKQDTWLKGILNMTLNATMTNTTAS